MHKMGKMVRVPFFSNFSQYNRTEDAMSAGLENIRPRLSRSISDLSLKEGKSASDSFIKEEKKKPLYLQVIEVVSPIVEKLIEQGIFQPLERKSLIALFIETDSSLDSQGINERCSSIVRRIYPPAAQCELKNFFQAINNAIEERTRSLSRQIASLQIESLKLTPEEVFPLKTDENPLLRSPSNGLEVLKLVNGFCQVSPYWSRKVSPFIQNFLTDFFNGFPWRADFDKIENSDQLATYLEGFQREALALESCGVQLAETVKTIVFDYAKTVYQASKEEKAFVANLERLAVAAEKCLLANLPFYQDNPPFIQRLRILYSSQDPSKVPPCYVQCAETILRFIDRSFVPKVCMKVGLAQDTLCVLTVAEENALRGQSEFFKNMENSGYLINGVLHLPQISPAIFRRLVKMVLDNAPQKDCSFEQWLEIFTLVDMFLFKNPLFLFNALHSNMIEPTPQGLANFLAHQPALEPAFNNKGDLKELWMDQRDSVVSLFLAERLQERIEIAKTEKKRPVLGDFFHAMNAFETQCTAQHTWMKITTFHVHLTVFAETLDGMAGLKALYRVVFHNSIPAPKTSLFDKLPQLKSLVVSKGWILDHFESSRQLHNLTLPVSALHYLSNWRILADLYPNLRELVLLENPDGSDEEWFDDPSFTEKDVVFYRNLEIFRGENRIFRGHNFK